jgi:hypothetical protein
MSCWPPAAFLLDSMRRNLADSLAINYLLDVSIFCGQV